MMMEFKFRGTIYTVKNEYEIEYNEDGSMQTTVSDKDGNEYEMIFDSEASQDIPLTNEDIIDVIQYK